MWKYAPMNRTVAMVICLSLVATGACSGDGDAEDSPANRQGSFSLLSYNVAGLPEGLSQSNPEANAPIISKMLGDYDVVVTQEDFGFYTDALRADAPQENMSTPHPGPGALNPIERGSAITGDGLNVMSNFRLIPPDLDRVPWTNCGEAAADCLALKGFAKTTLELESDPEKAVGGEGAEGEAGGGGDQSGGESIAVDLYTLHLEAGGEDDALRAEDLDLLASYLEEHSTDRPVIIGGDWNLHTDEEPDATQYAEFLAETGLRDVCSTVECGDDVDVIDKVAYRSSNRITLTPTSHSFERDRFVDPDGEPLSDHDPLSVDFDWEMQLGG
jgi:hypothetical protein